MDILGPGVSRVLQSAGTQYLETIWQQGKPPTDAELNLIQQLAHEGTQSSVLRGLPSGFLGNETNPQQAFVTHPSWSNHFRFGPQRLNENSPIVWANVNGWLIPVAGTKTGAPPGSPNHKDYSNVVTLDPPPGAAGDSRVDFIFLEAWKARIQPNPSTINKPLAGGIYKYGNLDTGFDYLPDDLVDPAIGFETNQRIQIQYRIRVVKGLVSLTSNPDGFDPDVVKAQGPASTATSYSFTNMRQELGDPGLWRAGDGTQNALGTVDGYTYAVPIAVVFRRNSAPWNGNPGQNLNGAYNRNPTAQDRTGVKVFSGVPTLSSSVTATATSLPLSSIANLPLPAAPLSQVLIRVGDELMMYSGLTDTSLVVLRGQAAGVDTVPQAHPAGTVVQVVSGRPDGLFSDQIASTDILDLRHLVNPNGFNYDALLKSNLDKLLRGQLRANWKLSGTGPRGPYVLYQDLLGSATTLSLGITKLDVPDNIRTVFSDAATIQPVELVCRPLQNSPNNNGSVPATRVDVDWALKLTVNTTRQTANSIFSPLDVLVIPVRQLKDGLGGANDQVRWLNDGVSDAVRIRVAGDTADLPQNMYTVTPAQPTPDDDLVITFAAGTVFPGTAANRTVHIRAHAVYGPGRGLSRRPDALHSISCISPTSDLLTQQWGIPQSNKGARVAWLPQWSKYRSSASNGLLPVTSEAYADLGSKTVVLTPFRRMDFPETVTVDGRGANFSCAHDSNGPVPVTNSPTSGAIAKEGSVITVTSPQTVAPVAVGSMLVISVGVGLGRYTVSEVNTTANTLTVDRPIRAVAGTVSFQIYGAQGCMPLLTSQGTPKWTQTDPLGLFCGTRASGTGPQNDKFESIYVSLPRHLMPGWGELHVPIRPKPTDYFPTGVNFMVRTSVTVVPPENQKIYAAYHGGSGSNEYAVFSTATPAIPYTTPLAYNTTALSGQIPWAGIRQFNDTRGLGRQGLEFPPFYGTARIMGVYQASDYAANKSPFDSKRATGAGTAVNLLRQSMGPQDGPTMWIETDSDGDSTFILNAKAIDISRAPSAIANFSAGNYVVEAVVFGFDRGSFDVNREFRMVLTRPLNEAGHTGGSSNPNAWAASFSSRANNINKPVAGLAGVLPGPASSSDQFVVNYSRTVYQGDAWGTQTSNNDLNYAPGPLLSDTAYQISRVRLNHAALVRPREKLLEVLASTTFSTSLGTGRFSGEASGADLDFRNVAYEDASPSVFPPASYTAARPRVRHGAFTTEEAVTIGPEYLGCTERLPLGALFRDKDFKGQAIGTVRSSLFYSDTVGTGPVMGNFAGSLELQEASIGPASSVLGAPGDLVTFVDGEQASTNYSLLTNFRTTRGGSVFGASGARPGGIMSLQTQPALSGSVSGHVLHGRAMLVRNFVTNVGASEVSAGDELMMLIVTTAQRSATTGAAVITLGTNGAGEGYSAADLYRIEGHPLIRNNIHLQLDPSTIVLGRG